MAAKIGKSKKSNISRFRKTYLLNSMFFVIPDKGQYNFIKMFKERLVKKQRDVLEQIVVAGEKSS